MGLIRDSSPDPTRATGSYHPPVLTRLYLQRISLFVAAIFHPPAFLRDLPPGGRR